MGGDITEIPTAYCPEGGRHIGRRGERKTEMCSSEKSVCVRNSEIFVWCKSMAEHAGKHTYFEEQDGDVVVKITW